MGFVVQVKGTVTADPLPTDPALLGKGMPLDFRKVYEFMDGGVYPLDGSPLDLTLGSGSTVLNAVSLRSVNADPLLVEISTAVGGAFQKVPVSGQLVLHNPVAGSEVLALRVTGPGRLEVLLAGNPA